MQSVDSRSPDHSVCRHCGEPITWDEWSYVHNMTGFADCKITITGGKALSFSDGTSVIVDAVITKKEGTVTCAEPVEWNENKLA